MLRWLCNILGGHSSSVDHCQTFSAFMIRLVKNLFLRQKCFIDTGCVCTSSVASKKSRHWTIGKNPFFEKKPIGWWCTPLHRSYCVTLHLFCFGGPGINASSWGWLNTTGSCYGKARLKEVLHAPPCTNIGQHRRSCVMLCSTQLWETHCSVTINPEGCIVVHCNLRVESSSL